MGSKPSITSGKVSRLAGSVPRRQVGAGHGVPETQACRELRRKKISKRVVLPCLGPSRQSKNTSCKPHLLCQQRARSGGAGHAESLVLKQKSVSEQ